MFGVTAGLFTIRPAVSFRPFSFAKRRAHPCCPDTLFDSIDSCPVVVSSLSSTLRQLVIEMDSFDGVRIIENSLNNSAYFPLISAVFGCFRLFSAVFGCFRLFSVRFGVGAFGWVQPSICCGAFVLQGFGPIFKGTLGWDRTNDQRIRNPKGLLVLQWIEKRFCLSCLSLR